MFTDTKKVFVIAGLIVAVGVTGVELTRSTAQAETIAQRSPVAAAAYAGARVDTTFDLIAAMPAVANVMIPVAAKGDLQVPMGCMGIAGDAQAECMDVAYELEATPSLVVETRIGSTSTLLRMDAMTLAGATDVSVPQSE